MRALTIMLGVVTCMSVVDVPPTHAQTGTRYVLGPNSFFQYGCFAPCLCPVFSSQSVQGTFDLKHLGFDGLYDTYEVSNVRWTVPTASTTLNITGSGLYRIGGEVAVQKQMVLDLAFGENPTQHFDSGLIGGEYDFPRIDISVSLHAMTCFDSVVHVQASPLSASSVEAETVSPGAWQVRAVPNPFPVHANLQLELAHPARVEVTIFDAQGRSIRHLTKGIWLPAGRQRLVWNGLRDDGRSCGSGVYFLRARIDGRTSILRLIKAR